MVISRAAAALPPSSGVEQREKEGHARAMRGRVERRRARRASLSGLEPVRRHGAPKAKTRATRAAEAAFAHAARRRREARSRAPAARAGMANEKRRPAQPATRERVRHVAVPLSFRRSGCGRSPFALARLCA
ncbi:hypothetical protein [Burkholderia pseudomallei]|uniref:hypothetical protein n=1 Tax=Burkholderia pseudomallei TaxID=28450 RepID=UPI000F0799B5|nr:hypothetical protein [Burkholderia pseudomallei]